MQNSPGRLAAGAQAVDKPIKMLGYSLLKKVQMREAKPDKGGSVHGRM